MPTPLLNLSIFFDYDAVDRLSKETELINNFCQRHILWFGLFRRLGTQSIYGMV